MTDEQATTSGLKAHIEHAEEQALGSTTHAQLEKTENTAHQYVPIPIELGLIAAAIIIATFFIIKKLQSH